MNNTAFELVPCIIITEDGYVEVSAKNIDNGFKRYMLDQVKYSLDNIESISLQDTIELMRKSGADETKIQEAIMLVDAIDDSIEQHDGRCAAIEKNLCDAYFSKLPKMPKDKVIIDGERTIVMPLGQNPIKKNVVRSLK
jgi:hypothetical protein